MLLYALALSFDGPGRLSTSAAVVWISIALGTSVGGLGLAFVALRWLLRSTAGAILGLLPGAVLCLYLLNMVVREAIKLAGR
ncbi:MAG: hypothetical protein HY680_01315 [Chloroflexi bacterium]|nr:hypothetical protein [Chloroflexota bacterium]